MLQQMTWVVPLIAFVVAWAGFAARAEGGWIIRAGGGFVVGCITAVALGGAYNWLFAPLVPKEAAPVTRAEAVADTRPIVAKADHNYDFAERGEYGYALAVSDLQRQAGQLAAQFVTYRYLGERDGRFQLYIRQGDVVTVLEATKPCKVIKTMSFVDADYMRETINVERIQCLPGTVGHLAFDDAMNGRLRTSDEVRRDGSRRVLWMDERKGLVSTKYKTAQ